MLRQLLPSSSTGCVVVVCVVVVIRVMVVMGAGSSLVSSTPTCSSSSIATGTVDASLHARIKRCLDEKVAIDIVNTLEVSDGGVLSSNKGLQTLHIKFKGTLYPAFKRILP